MNPKPVDFRARKWQRSVTDEKIAKAIVYGGPAVGLSSSMSANPDLETQPGVVAALVEHIRKFLLELGVGFSFVGSQYPLEVGGEDFRIDLLFYHLKLRCFVVIDLKTRPFKPEDAGKMNFYLSAVDDLLRHPTDQLSIGIVLCKGKNQVVAEYALRDMAKPLGISEFHYLEQLPDNLRGTLPTVEELEAELSKDGGSAESPTSSVD